MENEEFREIPGYSHYAVTRSGVVKSIQRDLILSQFLLNDYLVVNTFRGSKTETLPVHRAIALAWVNNPDPSKFDMVNHIDGIPNNNWYENLEWTDCSGNNYHAVNNGLRSDNIRCVTRDFFTGKVVEHSSMAQAAEYMGLSKDTPANMLQPKMFGKLVNGRFEFKYSSDTSPWFYEERVELVKPSRYMVIVTDPNKVVREVYSNQSFMKDYQLYSSQGKSIPALVEHARVLYPDHSFVVRDSYAEQQYRERRQTNPSPRIGVRAICEDNSVDFESLTQCAKQFKVDRSSIFARLDINKELLGWTFIRIQLPL